MNLSITKRPNYHPPVEFVERKGAGHPDTICDDMAERLCRDLARGFIVNTGAIQHFNVDKAVLAAGSARVGFGGGEHLSKARLILVGKADFRLWSPGLDALREEVRNNLAALLSYPAFDDAFEVDIWLSQSSSDLQLVISGREQAVPLSNDTSFAVASLNRSPLEEAVYQVETTINSDEFRRQVPAGRDIKVMGARIGDEHDITVAAPVMAGRVKDRAEYDEAIDAIRAEATRVASAVLGMPVPVSVNQADNDDSPYLTLSGTSAEAGDDGQVGRGNRFGGLITPYRPMSLEAAAGKNPASHVGKTYHAVAHDIATRVLAEAGANEATVKLLSRIGSPVTDPNVVHVEVAGDADNGAIESIVKESLADWEGVRDRLIQGHYSLY